MTTCGHSSTEKAKRVFIGVAAESTHVADHRIRRKLSISLSYIFAFLVSSALPSESVPTESRPRTKIGVSRFSS